VPAMCLLAACFGLAVAAAFARRVAPARPRARLISFASAAVVAVALLAQGLIHSVHSDEVLSRPYTLTLAREWMVDHIPRQAQIVLEPVEPPPWLQESPALGPRAVADSPLAKTARWHDLPHPLTRIEPAGASAAKDRWRVAHNYARIEDYEYTLSPALIDYYIQQRYCWVVSASEQSGRALADPHQAPGAIAYYQALARRAQVVYHLSPYTPGGAPVAFSFDWSFDDYPLSYRLPGPEVTIYRLHEGACDTSS
jgi:hypothetical protein